MKARVYGWRNKNLDQVSRVEEGLKLNNVEIVEDGNVDFIYSHCSSTWQQAIDYKQKYPGAKLLLKVLDLPIHLRIDFNKEKQLLSKADLVLANSKYVQRQIKEYLGLDSFVVYDVPQEVVYQPFIKKTFDFYMNGRLQDRNKRFFFAEAIMKMPENKDRIFACSGPESPISDIKVNYLGVMNLDGLTTLYNNAKMTFCFGRVEGIGLQMLESLICGTPIITLSDNPTSLEFVPQEFICTPNVAYINDKIKEIESNYEKFQKLALDFGNDVVKLKYSKEQIAKNVIEAYSRIA